MSIDELLDLLALRKEQDGGDWGVVIANEIANGELQRKQGQAATSQQLYDMAIVFLQAATPLVAQARIVLEEAQRKDVSRGGGTAASSALDALTEYEASVISMDAAILEAAEEAEGEGTVV